MFFRSTTCQEAFPDVCTLVKLLGGSSEEFPSQKGFGLDSNKHPERHIYVSLYQAVAKEMEINRQFLAPTKITNVTLSSG